MHSCFLASSPLTMLVLVTLPIISSIENAGKACFHNCCGSPDSRMGDCRGHHSGLTEQCQSNYCGDGICCQLGINIGGLCTGNVGCDGHKCCVAPVEPPPPLSPPPRPPPPCLSLPLRADRNPEVVAQLAVCLKGVSLTPQPLAPLHAWQKMRRPRHCACAHTLNASAAQTLAQHTSISAAIMPSIVRTGSPSHKCSHAILIRPHVRTARILWNML